MNLISTTIAGMILSFVFVMGFHQAPAGASQQKPTLPAWEYKVIKSETNLTPDPAYLQNALRSLTSEEITEVVSNGVLRNLGREKALERELETLGAEGWEVVSSSTYSSTYASDVFASTYPTNPAGSTLVSERVTWRIVLKRLKQ